jgi:hypothetical protein
MLHEVDSPAKINESNAHLYGIFNGSAELKQSVWIWVDVRDLALAHVRAIVSRVVHGCAS